MIGEDNRGVAANVVLNDRADGQRNAVAKPDIIANGAGGRHDNIRANIAIIANRAVSHNASQLPDFGVVTNLASGIDSGSLMSIVPG